MWGPQRLTTLWAFTACYRDSFTFTYFTLTKLDTLGFTDLQHLMQQHVLEQNDQHTEKQTSTHKHPQT
jgi:hypothetical protein